MLRFISSRSNANGVILKSAERLFVRFGFDGKMSFDNQFVDEIFDETLQKISRRIGFVLLEDSRQI